MGVGLLVAPTDLELSFGASVTAILAFALPEPVYRDTGFGTLIEGG